MTIFTRRCIAQAIDCILIGVLIALLGIILSLGMILMILCLIFMILFKDVVFRNASLGKKIAGIVIVNDDHTVPSLKKLLLRNLTLFVFLGMEYIQIRNGETRYGDKLAKTKVVLGSQF